MKHPDGTPYWEPTPIKTPAKASLDFITSTGECFTKGGRYMGEFATLTDCATAFQGETINRK